MNVQPKQARYEINYLQYDFPQNVKIYKQQNKTCNFFMRRKLLHLRFELQIIFGEQNLCFCQKIKVRPTLYPVDSRSRGGDVLCSVRWAVSVGRSIYVQLYNDSDRVPLSSVFQMSVAHHLRS